MVLICCYLERHVDQCLKFQISYESYFEIGVSLFQATHLDSLEIK